MGHIGSAVCCVGSVDNRTGSDSVVNCIGPEIPTADSSRGVAPGEADTDLAGDRGVEDVDQRDGSNLSLVVGYSCLHRTWKPLVFRVSAETEIAGGHTKSCSCGRERDISLWWGRRRGERYFGSYCCIQPGGKARASAGSDKRGVHDTTSVG